MRTRVHGTYDEKGHFTIAFEQNDQDLMVIEPFDRVQIGKAGYFFARPIVYGDNNDKMIAMHKITEHEATEDSDQDLFARYDGKKGHILWDGFGLLATETKTAKNQLSALTQDRMKT
jgi:hypothetical protein